MNPLSTFVFALILLTLTACSDTIPPPKLNGQWQVGATTFELGTEKKWVQIRAWYPSSQQSNTKLLSSDKHTIEAFSDVIGIPTFLMGSEETSRSNMNVKTARGTFPVIIFNHGLMSYARQNTTQFEQLASNGYIVLSVANPSDSMVVVRENGNIIKANKDGAAYQALQKQKDGAKALAPQLKKDIYKAKTSADFSEFSANMKTLANNPVFAPMSAVFESVLENNLHLLDSLNSIHNGEIDTPLTGHLDLQHIGAYGHSFGSILSGILAMKTSKIKAIMGLDAPQLNLTAAGYKPFSIPACYAYAGSLDFAGEVINFNGINKPLLKQTGSCEALFKGSAHYNFTDLNFVLPLRYSPMLGDVDNALMANNLESLLLSFFDTHLKQKDSLQKLELEQVNLTIY